MKWRVIDMTHIETWGKWEKKVIFDGRLGGYKYYDMDKVIKAALELIDKKL